jgi:hypothetical protein
MFRKFTAAIAAAAAITGLASIAAGAASASTTHSQYYVQVGHAWVPQDQLTPAQLNQLDNSCAPVVEAVLVDSLSQQEAPWGNVQIPVLGSIDGKTLIHVHDANAAQLTAANAASTGGPAFIGPSSYNVVGYSADGSAIYGC